MLLRTYYSNSACTALLNGLVFLVFLLVWNPAKAMEAHPWSGPAPLATTIESTEMPPGTAYWEFDWDGDGWVDHSGQDHPVWEGEYMHPGVYYPHFYFYDEWDSLIGEDWGEIVVEEALTFILEDSLDVQFDIVEPVLSPNYIGPNLVITPSSGPAPLEAEFTAGFVGPFPFTYWGLDVEGDGTIDFYDSEPVQYNHRYDNPGTFYPVLQLYDPDYNLLHETWAEVVVTDPNNITLDDPGADIWKVAGELQPRLIADPASGVAPLTTTIHIKDITDGDFFAWQLDVDRDGVPDFSDQHTRSFSLTFDTPGTHYLNMTFRDANWNEIASASTMLEVREQETALGDPPVAGPPPGNLFVSPIDGYAPMTVTYDARGTEPTGQWLRARLYANTRRIEQVIEPLGTVTFTEPGSYVIRYEYIDDNLQVISAFESTEIIVRKSRPGSENRPTLVADLDGGFDINDSVPYTVRWDASKSQPHAAIAKWEWDLNGDGVFEHYPNVTDVAFGSYYMGEATCSVRISDTSGQTAIATKTLLIGGAAPKLIADRYTGGVPLKVMFDASQSEPQGNIDMYYWDTDDDGDYHWVHQSSTPYWEYTFTQTGVYNVVLAIKSPTGNWLKTSVKIQVKNGGNPTAKITAINNQGPAPLTVRLDGTDSFDPEGPIGYYFWDYDTSDKNLAVQSDKPFFEHTYNNEGRYTASLVVMDLDGFLSEETTILVDAFKPRQGPVAVVSVTPTEGDAWLTVNCDATLSHTEHGIATYRWYKDINTHIYEDTTSPYHKFVYDTPGTYMPGLRIIDKLGNESAPGYQEIKVTDSTNQPPLVIVEIGRREGPAPLRVAFDASQSYDPDGQIDKFFFYPDINDDLSGYWVDYATWSHTYNTPGTYACAVYAVDATGLWSQATLTSIIVN